MATALQRDQRRVLAEKVVIGLVVAACTAGAIALLVAAACEMQFAKNTTEPQLAGGVTVMFATGGYLLWAPLVIVAACRSARLLLLTALLPMVGLLLASLPVLVNVCGRPGGSCG